MFVRDAGILQQYREAYEVCLLTLSALSPRWRRTPGSTLTVQLSVALQDAQDRGARENVKNMWGNENGTTAIPRTAWSHFGHVGAALWWDDCTRQLRRWSRSRSCLVLIDMVPYQFRICLQRISFIQGKPCSETWHL